jgi:hypothetical protein
MQEYKNIIVKMCMSGKQNPCYHMEIYIALVFFLFPFWKVKLSSSQPTKVNRKPRSDSALSHYLRHLADTKSFVVSG